MVPARLYKSPPCFTLPSSFPPFGDGSILFILYGLMKTEIFNLNLASPLYFVRIDDPKPFSRIDIGKGNPNLELLFCFELEEDQYRNFEPTLDNFFDNLLFGGMSTGDSKANSAEAGVEKPVELPAGEYLFSQKRELLSREEILTLAAEIQQEGLWQRHEPGKKFYLRYLFEDGKIVTQIFRPC